MPIFTLPLMFIAAAALPTVAGIYWLRNRFRRHPVSSLMLWADHRAPREGGARIQKLQTPLLFLLELLAIAMLVIAAAGPRWLSSRADAPLMVILDDSFSMQAQNMDDGRTSRDRALEALRDELGRQSPINARFVLAGAQPQVIGQTIRNMTDAEAALRLWRCESTTASIDKAITFASQLGGADSRLLVLTDRDAPEDLAGGRTQWWAFGEATSNIAIINAARQYERAGDRMLLEIANLSANPGSTQLTLTEPERSRPLRAERLTLGPGETRRLTLALPSDSGLVQVQLEPDAIVLDNTALLPPNPPRPVRVQTAIQHERLRRDVRKALSAMDRVTLATSNAQLLITDDPSRTVRSSDTWVVYLLTEGEDPQPYVGPFVVDKAHPLGDGLSLAGVIWSAPALVSDDADTGRPIVTAGNVPLITTYERLNDRHDIHIRLNPDLSTLARSVNWPILFWNIVDWRGEYLPGLEQTTARLDTSVTFVTDREATGIELTDPSGEVSTLPVGDRRVQIPASRPFLWTVRPIYDDDREAESYRFAVNPINHDESDLRQATSMREGRWIDDPALRRQYIDTAWVFALIALGLLGLHLFLVNQSSRGGVRA